ncbi:hypothetical protein [Brevundimonas sp. SORGH_AS_0993]|uniref:hypothetical protein n=1 Tax=Brevundimonas sp. SORGH_AS_0993 TaxID=3041794 RepID=UPI002786D3CD|nr:hypothetical protein [Brevundimonas sp. SORGH_AS_0993]MDQ1154331.1 hypothetical protein [Brevundimonas sp. SORGH_AS_0993]
MFAAWKTGTPAHRRYLIRTMAFTAPYVAISVAMMTTDAFDEIMGRPTAWVLAAVVSAPVIGQIWATLALMRESDEFVRGVTAKQFIVASGLTLAVAAFWGFGESFAGAPHMQTWLIVPVFWALYGIVSPFIRSSR